MLNDADRFMTINNKHDLFYSARVDGKTFTEEPATIKSYQDKGFTIKDSRLYGDKDVFLNGKLIAHLFKNKQEMKDFLLTVIKV